MTELAYLADMAAGYVRSFRARITALPPGAVVLDRTFFYPTGGGQPSDRGSLVAGAGSLLEVVDVSRSGTAVVHRIRGPAVASRALSRGLEVEGTLDWDRRYRHMRLHTAQHLLSARLYVGAGRRTRRANLGSSSATLELDGPLTENQLRSAAAEFRQAVASPHEVTIRRIPRPEWDRNPLSGRSGLVPLPAHVDPVRVIEIYDEDLCPCGGTHVASTGEIGTVRFDPVVPIPDGSRVRFTLDGLAHPIPSG